MKNLISRSRFRIAAFCWALCSFVFFAYLATLQFGQGRIETDILKLLPATSNNDQINESVGQFARASSSKLVLLVGANETAQAIRGTQLVSAVLRGSKAFREVRDSLPADPEKSLRDYYFGQRTRLLTSEEIEWLRQPDSAARLQEKIVGILATPFSGAVGFDLREDPFGFYLSFLQRLSPAAGNFRIEDGYLVGDSSRESLVLILAELSGSAFSREIQADVSEALRLAQVRLSDTCVDCSLRSAGVVRYAKYAADNAEKEITFIGLGSLVGVTFLIWVMFFSIVPLIMMFVTVFISTLAAFSLTLLVFDHVHMITLGFGASLIGVGVDHGFHYFCHQAYERDEDSFLVLRKIFPSITFGILSTILGYLGLFAAPFPGLNEIAFFSIVGLSAGYLTVIFWYPFLPRIARRSREPWLLRTARAWITLWRKRSVFISAFCSMLLLGVVAGVSRMKTDDDVRLLQERPQDLFQEEVFIRKTSGMDEDARYIIVSRDSETATLESNARVSRGLDALVGRGTLGGFQSLTQFVPAPSEQAESAQAVLTFVSTHRGELEESFRELGMAEGDIRTVLDATLAPAPGQINVSSWLASDVSLPYRHLWLGAVAGRFESVIMLNDVNDSRAIRDLARAEQVTYIDQVEDASKVLGSFREQVSIVVPTLYFLVLIFMLWRYGWRDGFIGFVPAVIAAAACLAVQTAFSQSINLFSLLAVLIVLGLGIDYAIFFLEGEDEVEATTMAVVFSALSTFLSLALLALCTAPVLQIFGQNLLVGTALAMLLSPIVLWGKDDANSL